MPRKSYKENIEVIVDIQPGVGSAAQRRAWETFWVQIIMKAKEEEDAQQNT